MKYSKSEFTSFLAAFIEDLCFFFFFKCSGYAEMNQMGCYKPKKTRICKEAKLLS